MQLSREVSSCMLCLHTRTQGTDELTGSRATIPISFKPAAAATSVSAAKDV